MKKQKNNIRGTFITPPLHHLIASLPCRFIASSPYHFITSSLLFLCLSVFNLHAQTQKTWQWVKQIGGDSWDISAGVTCDSKNNLYVAGSYYHTLHCSTQKVTAAGNQDAFIVKYNENGDVKDLWSCGGKGRDVATCLCTMPGDNIAIGGILSDTAAFGKTMFMGSGSRLFVATLDAKGNFAWVTTMAFTGDASLFMIGADHQGMLYVSGVFTGTLEAGKQQVSSLGKKDIFLARISHTGEVEKLVSFGSEEDDSPGALSVDTSGHVALTGTFGKTMNIDSHKLTPGPSGTKTNVFVAGFDRDLKTLWCKVITGEEYCQVASLKHDNLGNLYAAGSFTAKIHINDTVLASKGYTDAFMLKYAPDGNMLWSKSFGSWYYDYANHINPDNLGGAIITGSIGDTLEVDTLTITPGVQGNAALIIQFSPQGKAIWADCISGKGSNFSDGSVLDHKGNLYLTGSFRNTFQKGDDALTSFGDQDVFLAKYYNCPTGKAEIFGPHSFCPGMGAELSIARGFKDVVWNDTLSGTNYFIARKPGQYWVSMYDKKGCLLSDTLTMEQAPLPAVNLGTDTTLLVSDSLLLHAPARYVNFHWQDFSSEPTFLAKAPEKKTGMEKYWLSVTDSLGCSNTDTIAITYVKGYNWVDLNTAQLVTYPNPVNDRIYWYVKTDQPCRLVVTFTDENGRILNQQYLEQYQPGDVKEMYLGNIPVGSYYLRINGSAETGTFKAVRVIKQ